MSADTQYAKSNNGLVHLVSAAEGEHTLCGDAFDIDACKGGEEHAWKIVKRGPVTCPICARVITSCRGVRLNVKEQ